MANWYFTFGQAHETVTGIPMKNFWVRVVAEDFGAARMKFIQEWSSKYMPKPDKWAFQYKESDFKSEYFPLGEYAVIE